MTPPRPETRRRAAGGGLLLALALALLLGGCAGPAPRLHATALTPSEVEATALGRWASRQAAAHPGDSGFALLASGRDAFRLRARLSARAERGLDIQTYHMGGGRTTRRLLRHLLEAAERGVRVRLLLDDFGTAGQGERLAALDSHPRIEVRVYNALALGRGSRVARALASLPWLGRQHRRMHNKLWLADGAVAIVGGRNLGDEYYAASRPRNFTDLDLLALGPVVPALARSFDLYWNHGLAQPLARYHRAPSGAWRGLATTLAAGDAPGGGEERGDGEPGPLPTTRLHWGAGVALWDPPGKLAWPGRPPLAATLAGALERALPPPEKQLTLIAAYFVPGTAGTRWLTDQARRGVAVTALTNALEATDVPLVHGAYQRSRLALLAGGVTLYELKSTPVLPEESPPPGTSASALHIKALASDDRWLFVGSANADPRSLWWNTEVGLLVDSVGLAAEFAELAAWGQDPALSYRVMLSDTRLHWVTEAGGRRQRWVREPGSRWRQVMAWLGRVLPLAPWL